MAYPNDPPVPSGLTPLSSDPVNTALVGWWPLTDGTGTTAKDISTGANDATAGGTVTWETTSNGAAA